MSSFRTKLQSLPSGYTYLHFPQTEQDTICFRIKEVNDKLSAEIWKKKLEFCSKVTWRIGRTFPKVGKTNAYKVDLRCQHSRNHIAGLRSSKTTNCNAFLQIIVKRFKCNDKEQSSSNHIDAEWPAQITFRGNHNHSVNSAEALKYRDLSHESKEKLRLLFHQGYDPATALYCLKTDLQLQHGDNYNEIALDGYYLPNPSIVRKLFTKEFYGQSSAVSEDQMLNNLSKMLEHYCKTTSGKAELCQSSDGAHYFITLCSPIMMRSHTMQQTGEFVLVDALGGMNKQMHHLYFFVTPTPAGGLPVAAIIANSGEAYIFQEALVALKSILPEHSFNGKNMPKVILTDGNLNVIKPLEQEFPKSSLLLSQFYFLKRVWSWLGDKSHSIPRGQRQKLYFLVKDVLYAWDEENALKKHSLVLSSEIAAKYPNFLHYYDMLWQEKDDWTTYSRQNTIVECSNMPNYGEAVFKILNKCILERVLHFNLTQLTNFILTRYEMELEKWLLDFCIGKYPKSLLTSMLPKDPADKPFSIKKSNTNKIFMVSEAQSNKNYLVDIDCCICSCFVGKMGRVCKHAAIIVFHLEKDVCSEVKLIPKDVKEQIFYVAKGNAAPEGWCELLERIINAHMLQHEAMNITNSDISDAEPDISPMEVTVTENPSDTEDHVTENPSDTEDHVTENLSDTEDHVTENTSDTEDHVTTEELAKFHTLCARMQKGLKENPRLFKPALENMLKNEAKYSTEMGLVTAMHNFGACPDLKQCKMKTCRSFKGKPLKNLNKSASQQEKLSFWQS